MKTTTEYQKLLLKKYHTICTIAGIRKEEKDTMIAAYGKESSRDLTEKELIELIDALNRKPEQWRRRVMGSIGAWLRSIQKDDNSNIIKGIACRAAQMKNFNSIPVSRLRDIYYEFSRKAKTAKTAQMVIADEINYLSSQN